MTEPNSPTDRQDAHEARDLAESRPPASDALNEPELLAIARTQRLLLWHVLALVLITATQCVAPVNAPPGIAALKLSVYAVVTMLTITQAVRLSIACGGSGAMTWVAALLLFIPIVNFALLASLNARATERLRAHGIRVGVMGAAAGELAKLRPGVCRACGYDLVGLDAGPCPECGYFKMT